MNLYYALTKHQQIACMLHKALYMKEEPAHLYISNGNNIETTYIEKLKATGFFSEVIVMDDQPVWALSYSKDVRDEENLKDVMRQATEICEKSLVLPLEDYDEIYVAADHFPLGMVLVFNGISYHYIEEATGAYANYDLWLRIVAEQKNTLSYEFATRYGLQGRADCVVEKLIDVDNQLWAKNKNDDKDDKIVDFSLSKLLKKIDYNSKQKILEFFGIDNKVELDEKNKSAIIMTEYLAHAKFCSWDEQREIYGRFIDYFCDDMNVFIKPHPNDFQGTYEQWFPNTVQIDRNIPAELLPLMIEQDFNLAIALTSTSVFEIRGIVSDIYYFRNKDLRSIQLIKQMDSYYVASWFIENCIHADTVLGIGADSLQIRYFLKSMGNSAKVKEWDQFNIPLCKKRMAIVIDSLKYVEDKKVYDLYQMLEDADKNNYFIFINTDKDVLFFDDEFRWARYTVPVHINLDKRDGSKVSEWIYIYTKDDVMKKEIMITEINKMLMNAGIEVKVNNDGQSVRERMLEGMLNATEQKCNILIKRK